MLKLWYQPTEHTLKSIKQIKFFGKVCDGAGRFSKENIIKPFNKTCKSGWPTDFEPGTFNIRVDDTNWPDAQGLDFRTDGLWCMDRNTHFKPAHYLPYTYIPNNTLNPNNKGQYGGDLQFWRAILKIGNSSEIIKCYMLRRVRSGYKDKIELVSGLHIRKTFNIGNCCHAQLTVLED